MTIITFAVKNMFGDIFEDRHEAISVELETLAMDGITILDPGAVARSREEGDYTDPADEPFHHGDGVEGYIREVPDLFFRLEWDGAGERFREFLRKQWGNDQPHLWAAGLYKWGFIEDQPLQKLIPTTEADWEAAIEYHKGR